MAKQGRTLPARRAGNRFDDSVLIRSAESLGRVIGSLQRQLEGVTKHLAGTGNKPASGPPRTGVDGYRAKKRKPSARTVGAKATAERGTPAKRRSGGSGAGKTRSTVDRTSKRAAKSAAAKKSSSRRTR